MSRRTTHDAADEPWSAARRRHLEAVVSHLLPHPEAERLAGPVAAYVRRGLGDDGSLAFVLATLDEGAQRAGRPLDELPEKDRESLLRGLESDADMPFLGHALGRILSLILEGFYGDPIHGANPEAVSWQDLGIGAEGMHRRAKP